MIIKTLVENTSVSDEYGCEHGLSLYIETAGHRILFDTGASPLFARNAAKMGVDLASVDISVISHDHYDHGGGLKAFLDINDTAKIYVNREAFGKRYARTPAGDSKYIGLAEGLLPNDRFVFVSGHSVIDDELELFSGVKASRLNPSGNQDLLMVKEGNLIPDDFAHEQNLIIKDKENILLVAGCAHNGIINIIEHMEKSGFGVPTHVIGGFHLYNRSADRDEDPEIVKRIGNELMKWDAKFYTCHCTGLGSYAILRSVMGEKIGYLASGSQLII